MLSTNLAHSRLQLPTGVPGLDDVLGGGIPESAFTVISGGPGSGKSTLAQHILMANVSAQRPGIYFLGPGQPRPDPACPDVHYVYLGDQLAERDASRVLDLLVRETYNHDARFAVVDMVRGLTHPTVWNDVVLYLSNCGASSFLISDGAESDAALSAADVVVSLRQSLSAGAPRTLQVMKVRGQEPLSGPHAMRITREGMQVFPRWPTPSRRVERLRTPTRLSVGIDELDELLGGGAPIGGSLLVEGPSGSGKSILATQFISECGHNGYPGLALLFEERPDRFIARADAMHLELERLNRCGIVDVLSFRGRDLSSDELIYEAQRAVRLIGAQCVVIDSTAGLELILNSGDDVVDCLWRLIDSLSGMGVTVWINDTPSHASRLSLRSFVDDAIQLRREAHDGQPVKRLEVVKVSCHASSGGVHMYEIGERGVEFVTRIRGAVEHSSNGTNGTNGSNGNNGHVIGYNGFAVSRSA